MQSFFPPGPVSVDAYGKQYPYIDAAGLHSTVDAVTVSLVAVDGVNYSYLVLVSVAASSPDSSVTASRDSVLQVTIDADGRFTETQGWGSSFAARSTS